MEPLDTFMSASFEQRLDLISRPEVTESVGRYLGADVAAKYRRIAARSRPGDHLGQRADRPLIFVPGVMGSTLVSHGLGGVWWLDMLAPKHIDRLKMDRCGHEDADPRADVSAAAVHVGYEDFLAAVHAQPGLWPVAAHYDWRKPLADSCGALAELITAQVERTGKRAHVVAHSMGGLLVRVALMRHPELWDRIDRIVFLGTPHYGSPSIADYLKNHLIRLEMLRLLGRFLSRETLRSMWGVISLLPAPAGIYPDSKRPAPGDSVYHHPCANFDLYDVTAWHLDLPSADADALQAALDAAGDQYRLLEAWHDDLPQARRDRLAVVAGVGQETLTRTTIRRPFGRTTPVMKVKRQRDGDGRVPVASAELPHIGATRYAPVEHDDLHRHPAVHADVFRFLAGKIMQLPRTAAGASRSHLGGDFAFDDEADDDSAEDIVSEARVDELYARLAAHDLPAFATIRLL